MVIHFQTDYCSILFKSTPALEPQFCGLVSTATTLKSSCGFPLPQSMNFGLFHVSLVQTIDCLSRFVYGCWGEGWSTNVWLFWFLHCEWAFTCPHHRRTTWTTSKPGHINQIVEPSRGARYVECTSSNVCWHILSSRGLLQLKPTIEEILCTDSTP